MTCERLPFSGERTFPNLNLEPTIEHELRLAELLAVSLEVVEAQRPVLWDMVQTGLASCLDAHDQQAMQLTGHALDWELFGRSSEQLPPGLIWVGGRHVDYDPRYWFNESCRRQAQQRLDELGLDSVITAVREDVASRQEEIYEAARDFIVCSPEYRLAQSFNMRLPSDPRFLPLSPFFRAIRESQIEEEVKLQYGIGGKIDSYDMAANALRRRLQLLDTETMPANIDTNTAQDTYTRARAFFGERVFVACANQGSYMREALDRFDIEEDEGNGYVVIRFKEPDNEADCVYEVGEFIAEAAEVLANELSEAGTPFQRWIGRDFLDYFMQKLLDPRTHMPYDALIEEATQEAAVSVLRNYLKDVVDIYMSHDNLPLHIRRPAGGQIPPDVHDRMSAPHKRWHYDHYKGAGFSTTEELARKERTVVGSVLKRPWSDTTVRLIQAQSRDVQVPQVNAGDALRVTLTAGAFKPGADPYIPGYRLSSRNGDTYGFIRDPVDPYARADVNLGSAQRDILAQHYSQLGLRLLAESIQGSQGLTVDRLVDLIRASSHYAMPKKTRPSYKEGDELPSSFEANQLSDFLPFVKREVLHVQCNGSAKFLKLSLEAAFGHGSATVTVGNVLKNSKTINAAGHAQTTFVHGDRLYLLDATPSRVQDGRMGFGFGFMDIGHRIPPRAATLVEIPALPSLAQSEFPIDTAELRRQRLLSLQRSIEIQLSVLFGVAGSDALYGRAVKLSQYDPVRQTLEAFVRAPIGRTTIEDLDNLTDYLQRYQEAPVSLLRRMQLPEYEFNVLSSLVEPVRQLAAYYRGSDD